MRTKLIKNIPIKVNDRIQYENDQDIDFSLSPNELSKGIIKSSADIINLSFDILIKKL